MRVNRHTAGKIRKRHRYLRILIGIPFLMWTLSGFYFSWADLDEIHGVISKKEHVVRSSFTEPNSPSK